MRRPHRPPGCLSAGAYAGLRLDGCPPPTTTPPATTATTPPRPRPAAPRTPRAALVFDDPLDQQTSDDTDRGWGERPRGEDAAADLRRFLDEKPPHHL
ncbi:hypothetical protein [Streptomyces sp. MJP52]|uniref:hypothetical protein n=1 Tax=Streptomyces sp. MJP52 TaxID=2940555 RepID=UPI0024745318|nr:hypothetical protein [Streptomyces sp. MJP52]MDH6226496.1 hypothetical protein [Streptomyces sp. MJP52]